MSNNNIYNDYIESTCYNYYLKCNNDIDKIKICAELLKLSVEEFLKSAFFYIEKNIKKPEYVKLLDTFSLLQTDEEVIKFFDNFKVDFNYLNNNLISYYLNYRPHIFFLQNQELYRVREMLRKYDNYLYRKMDPVRTNTFDSENYASNTIKAFINSHYSKKRFCFNNSIGCLAFKDYISVIKKNDKELYDEYLTNLKIKDYEKKETIVYDILNILDKLKQDFDNFTLIDFCIMTNYHPTELIEEADKILELEDRKLFRLKLGAFDAKDSLRDERLTRLFKTDYNFNVDNEIINISEEEKYAVISYLNQYNIPICNETFRDGCIKLIKKRKENIIK